MQQAPPEVYLARHGNTAWTLTGQHTGLTDLPLTPNGECNARRLGERLKGMTFAKVFTSPLQRASRTCELAGFGAVAETDPDLVEWNYGEYEGLRMDEILRTRPDWQLFRDGLPAANRRRRSVSGQIAWLRASARLQPTCCFFPAGISSAFSPPAGWHSTQVLQAGIFS
jgi:probable phosphoglycerate mutase